MEIDVIADAGAALYGDWVPFFGSASDLARHDLELTKPSLLFASHTTLHTGNFALASQMKTRLTRLTMPLPAIVLVVRSCANMEFRSTLIAATGLSEDDLIPYDAATRLVEGFTAEKERGGASILRLTEPWSDKIDDIADAMQAHLALAFRSLVHDELRLAEARGLLTIRAHTKDLPPLTLGPTVGDSLRDEIDVEEYFERAFDEVASLLADPAHTPLLDPWATQVAESMGLVQPGSTAPLAATLGTTLLAAMPTVERASVAEILEIREQLSAPLVRFRAAMVDAANEFETVRPPSVQSFLQTLVTRDIEPALADIEDSVRADTYISQLVRVVTAPKDMIASAGSFMLAATAGGTVSQLAGAALGVGLPFAKAALDHRDKRRANSKNKFFLLHKLRER